MARIRTAFALCLAGMSFLAIQPLHAESKPAASPAPATQEARPARIPAASFAAANLIRDAKLSPDGKWLAFTTPLHGNLTLVVEDPDSQKLKFALNSDPDHEFNWFRWAGNGKLLTSVTYLSSFEGEEIRTTRLLVSDIETRKTIYIGPKSAGIIGDDVLYVEPDGQFVIVAIQRSIFDYPSVWRFPLDETARKVGKEIQPPIDGAWNWYTDDTGNVRMAAVFLDGKVKILYRQKPEDPLKPTVTLTKQNFDDKQWDVERIFAGTDQGFAIERNLTTNRAELVEFNYATRTSGATVYANPDADVTDYDVDDHHKLKAVFFTEDSDRVVWFDPVLKKTQTMLNKALPGSDLWVSSRARDDSRMLVWQSGSNDPGAIYLFDAKSRKLAFLTAMRPDINPAWLAKPEAIDYKARDGVTIRAYLTLPRGRPAKNLPLIILPHGGPYGVRDKLDYSDEVQLLANRGYAVLQPNYRGSDGYGEGFAGLGEGQIGRAMQDDLDDGMDHLAKQGTIDAKRVCIVGSSYGGYAAVWGVIRNPERYRCAASFAGVMDWKRQLKFQNNKETDGTARSKWSRTVRGGSDGKFDLTLVSPVQQIARLTRPVLLVHGDKDTRVPFSQFKDMAAASTKAGKDVEQLVIAGAGHGFDKPEDEVKWYNALDAFLAKFNPAD